ncbi:exosortase F system-associated protein [uncultured Algibacter sp.]|uniref:exosortase F system-associated membrane protein n=1 Tax=uncultured Algibacter sp. TaxID=298659 RepID=UPI00261BF1B3|nr:exosortase F system-associated protein [uncultured Algibacter sp.]
MSRALSYILVSVLIIGLVLIRFFEDTLFYDPYLTFFQSDYLYIDSPRREVAKLIFSTVLRYALNTIISLVILFLVFKDRSVVKFSGMIYLLAFVLLMMAYMYFVINPKQEDYYLFFNVRRFLIQPIILILLIPAFYYHKYKS